MLLGELFPLTWSGLEILHCTTKDKKWHLSGKLGFEAPPGALGPKHELRGLVGPMRIEVIEDFDTIQSVGVH